MPDISNMDPDARLDLIARLKKIEGQARGIQNMIDQGRDCELIINQVAAMQSATRSMNGRLLELYALYCIENPEEFGSTDRAISKMIKTVVRAAK